MGAALKFKQSQVPRQQGEQARLKVIKGPDVGSVFVVQGAHATIGRGEENDIVLTDLRASRRHAELILTAAGWTVQDLGSANGISCNGKASRSGVLTTKDTLGLGETLFEFMTQEAPTIMLSAPPTTEQQIQTEQAGLAAQRARIVAMSQFGGLAKNRPRTDNLPPIDRRTSAQPTARTQPAKKPFEPKQALLVLAVLAGGYFFLLDGGGPTAAKKSAKSGEPPEKLEPPDIPAALSEEVEKTAEMFYRSGFREYRTGNFLRARTQFETVLQMAPGHSLAKIYLQNSNQRIEEEVRENLEHGRKSFEAGKLKAARGHFEAVIRLLFRDQANPAYTEAKDQLDKVLKVMEDTD